MSLLGRFQVRINALLNVTLKEVVPQPIASHDDQVALAHSVLRLERAGRQLAEFLLVDCYARDLVGHVEPVLLRL